MLHTYGNRNSGLENAIYMHPYLAIHDRKTSTATITPIGVSEPQVQSVFGSAISPKFFIRSQMVETPHPIGVGL